MKISYEMLDEGLSKGYLVGVREMMLLYTYQGLSNYLWRLIGCIQR